MSIDPQQIGTMAMQLMDDMEKEYGSDATVTALLTVAAVKDTKGQVFIQYRAADGEGDGLAPWHVKGILGYIDSYIDKHVG